MTKFSSTFPIALSLLVVMSSTSLLPLRAQPAEKPKKVEFKHTGEVFQFPDVPQYTGKTSYQGASQYPAQNGVGRLVNASFLVQEDPDTVLQWYSEALKTYQWKMGDTKGQSKSIYGSKGKSTCSVSASNYKGPYFRTQVTISYRYAQ